MVHCTGLSGGSGYDLRPLAVARTPHSFRWLGGETMTKWAIICTSVPLGFFPDSIIICRWSRTATSSSRSGSSSPYSPPPTTAASSTTPAAWWAWTRPSCAPSRSNHIIAMSLLAVVIVFTISHRRTILYCLWLMTSFVSLSFYPGIFAGQEKLLNCLDLDLPSIFLSVRSVKVWFYPLGQRTLNVWKCYIIRVMK